MIKLTIENVYKVNLKIIFPSIQLLLNKYSFFSRHLTFLRVRYFNKLKMTMIKRDIPITKHCIVKEDKEILQY